MNLEQLLTQKLQILHLAEQRLLEVTRQNAQKAQNPELKQGFEQHARETEQQVQRLQQCLQQLGGQQGQAPQIETLEAMVRDAQKMEQLAGQDPILKDTVLIASAQHAEHWEICAYGTARAMAEHLGQQQIAALLQQSEQEEEKTDKLLTKAALKIYQQQMQNA